LPSLIAIKCAAVLAEVLDFTSKKLVFEVIGSVRVRIRIITFIFPAAAAETILNRRRGVRCVAVSLSLQT
jgi:hypothetical protein